jgi:hypothetical protein
MALVVTVLLAVPVVALAACPPGQEAVGTNADGTEQCAPAAGGGGGSTAGGGDARTILPNPLGEGVTDISQIVGNVLRALFGILGSIALLMFIYGGFTWLTSGGVAEKIQKGKDTMVWAVLGIAITFAAYTIVNFVIDALVKRS